MKKDLDWVIQEIHATRKVLADSESSGNETADEFTFNNGKEEGLVIALKLLDQLDEPEVLSQEWISENVEYAYFDMLDGSGRLSSATAIIKPKKIQNLLVPKQEEITHKQVEKYLLDKNIRVIDIDIYEEMQSELEELKNGATLSEMETVADVIADFYKSLERLKEVMSMEVEELEE